MGRVALRLLLPFSFLSSQNPRRKLCDHEQAHEKKLFSAFAKLKQLVNSFRS